MGDNRISRRPSGDAAAAVAEAARRAAAEAARRAAETAARQAAQQTQRAAGTAPLPDQQAVSQDASLERNTGPLGGAAIAEAPEIPGAAEFELPPAEEEQAEPTGGAGGPPPDALREFDTGLREVNSAVQGTRGNFAQTAGELIGAARGRDNLTPENRAIVDQAEARQNPATIAADALAVADGIVTTGQGLQTIDEGDVVEGVAEVASGVLQTGGKGVNLLSSVQDQFGFNQDGSKSQDRLGNAIAAGADIAGGVSSIAGGISDLQDGQIVDGVIGIASGAADTAAGASSAAANLVARGSVSSSSALGRFGQRAPTFAGVAGVLGGAVAVSRGVDAIRDGRILEGTVTIAQGGLGAAAGAAGSVASFHSLGSAASVAGNVAKFSKLANQFGGAAAIVGGGFQAFTALSADPPDIKGAAIGGANVVGGALLMTTPSPAAAVGGAILIGTALYENVAPVADVVDGVVGGVINVGEGVIAGVGEVAEGFSDARDELLEGDVLGAGVAAIDGVLDGAGEVLEGLGEGVERLSEGLEDAAGSIGRGIRSAAGAVGDFVGGLI